MKFLHEAFNDNKNHKVNIMLAHDQAAAHRTQQCRGRWKGLPQLTGHPGHPTVSACVRHLAGLDGKLCVRPWPPSVFRGHHLHLLPEAVCVYVLGSCRCFHVNLFGFLDFSLLMVSFLP